MHIMHPIDRNKGTYEISGMFPQIFFDLQVDKYRSNSEYYPYRVLCIDNIHC